MKISELIKELESNRQVHGDADIVFDIPELSVYGAEYNIWGDRADGFKSKRVHFELYESKLIPDYEGQLMRRRNPPTQG